MLLRGAGLCLLVLVWLGSSPAGATELHSYETDYLKLVYTTREHEYLVPHLARSFENSLRFHRHLFDYTPSEKIVVLLHDFGDFGHGGTSTVPWNYITLGIEPFDYVYETMPANERMNWLMHHELAHVVATDKGAGADRAARRLFLGKISPTTDQPLSMLYSWMTSPRWYAPRWYHEGIATFLETWMAGGIGRVLGGYDEMVFRTMVLEDRHFYDIVGLESEGTTIDFQVGQNSYLYGTRFVSWLAVEHGPDRIVEWFDRGRGSRRHFSHQFREVYGVSLADEWRRWIEAERAWQAQNLERIRTYPVTAEQALVDTPVGSASRTWYDPGTNRIYAAINYPARPAHLAAIDLESRSVARLADVSQPALYYVSSVAFDPERRKLYYTTDNSRGWRDLMELDVDTGRSRRLLDDARTGDLVVDRTDGSIWGVQHHNGLSSIVRIPPPHEGWQTLVTLDYGRDVFDLDLSPDGKLLTAALIEIDGSQRLVRLSTEKLVQGDASYDVLHEFENNSPANFVFSPDGRYLYGTSYYTGVSNVFRYDLENEKMEALTNAETGYFRPLPLPDGRLVALRYTAEGLLPVELPVVPVEDVEPVRYLGQEVVERHPVVRDWNAGSPMQVDLDQVSTRSGRYRGARGIRLASIYPVVEGYRDTWAAGARMSFGDPLGLNSIDLTVTGSPSDEVTDDGEEVHAYARWRRWPWTIDAGHNRSDFYDLFGPTEVSRKGNFLRVAYDGIVFDHQPRSLGYHLSLAGYSNLDTLPLYQNVEATVDRYASLTGELRYSHLRRTIGAVDAERGVAWELGSISQYGDDRLFPKAYFNLDWGVPTGIPHSSIWFRPSIGRSFGDEEETFSSFYFGAFGNNWVDHGPVRRYRQYDAFPGVELNEVQAHDHAKLLVEWVLPPVRFRRAGSPTFYSNWVQVALFTGGLVANVSSDLPRREVGDVGLQVDLRLVLFSNLQSTLSFGYATAFEAGRAPSDEFMGSLRILH